MLKEKWIDFVIFCVVLFGFVMLMYVVAGFATKQRDIPKDLSPQSEERRAGSEVIGSLVAAPDPCSLAVVSCVSQSPFPRKDTRVGGFAAHSLITKEIENRISFLADPILFGTAKVTAYSKLETCPNSDCEMASGRKVYIGAVACPRSISLGTQISIDGKSFICEDRTHRRFDGRFDIYMGEDYNAYINALEWGIQDKQIFIYESEQEV